MPAMEQRQVWRGPGGKAGRTVRHKIQHTWLPTDPLPPSPYKPPISSTNMSHYSTSMATFHTITNLLASAESPGSTTPYAAPLAICLSSLTVSWHLYCWKGPCACRTLISAVQNPNRICALTYHHCFGNSHMESARGSAGSRHCSGRCLHLSL